MKKKIMIVRHGQTEWNKEGRIQGHTDTKLSELGIEQARRLAERLKDEKIDFIFSSDLLRAADTAKEVAKFHPEVPIYFVEELRERFLGDMQGKTWAEVPGWGENVDKIKIMRDAGCEEIEDLFERASDFRDKIINSDLEGNILFVTHGGIVSANNAGILGEEWIHMHRNYKPKNTGFTILDIDKDKKPKISLMNCTKHLEDIG